jgi:hypothetical protein
MVSKVSTIIINKKSEIRSNYIKNNKEVIAYLNFFHNQKSQLVDGFQIGQPLVFYDKSTNITDNFLINFSLK